jgi:hypothetical protein
MSLLLIVHLPLATLLSDVCVFVDYEDTSLTNVPIAARSFVQTCFDNTPLVNAFPGVTDQMQTLFDLNNSVNNIPTDSTINNAFNFPLLNDLQSRTDNATSTPAINQTLLDTMINQFNSESDLC